MNGFQMTGYANFKQHNHQFTYVTSSCDLKEEMAGEICGKLSRLVADISLDRHIREIGRKKLKTSPSARVAAVDASRFALSTRRVSGLMMTRSAEELLDYRE
jgi:hypothetical protein